jgi:hypothetical protein
MVITGLPSLQWQSPLGADPVACGYPLGGFLRNLGRAKMGPRGDQRELRTSGLTANAGALAGAVRLVPRRAAIS